MSAPGTRPTTTLPMRGEATRRAHSNPPVGTASWRAWRPPPPTPPRAARPFAARLDRYFDITARGSSIPTEVRGGAATFLTMAYILFVNPQILGLGGRAAAA